MKLLPISLAFCAAGFLLPSIALATDLAELEQQSLQTAIERVAPSVVQIRTVGNGTNHRNDCDRRRLHYFQRV